MSPAPSNDQAAYLTLANVPLITLKSQPSLLISMRMNGQVHLTFLHWPHTDAGASEAKIIIPGISLQSLPVNTNNHTILTKGKHWGPFWGQSMATSQVGFKWTQLGFQIWTTGGLHQLLPTINNKCGVWLTTTTQGTHNQREMANGKFNLSLPPRPSQKSLSRRLKSDFLRIWMTLTMTLYFTYFWYRSLSWFHHF